MRQEPLYADVIVPRHISKAFTYLVPAALQQTLAIGRQVLVPFGRTVLQGVVHLVLFAVYLFVSIVP